MGDTYDSLSGDTGVSIQLVCLIEGFPYGITDGPTARALTAIEADTEITQMLGGLQVHWEWRQQFTPWEPAIDVSSLRIGVMDTSSTRSDVFGKAIFGRGAGNSTFLEGSIDCNDTTVTAKRVNDFAASGSIYIGTEHVTYSSKSTAANPDTFTVAARGKFAPFRANTETEKRFGRPHRLPIAADGVYSLPVISDEPRTWRGRWIGIWAHVIRGGVLDVLAEAQLLWAGRIKEWADAGSGLTIVTAEDARSAIKDSVLLNRQWHATLADGIYLTDGMEFDAADYTIVAGTETAYAANSLKVVAASPGTNEILAGRYTLEELASEINDWLAAETAASRLIHEWTYSPTSTSGANDRARFVWTGGTSQTNKAQFRVNTLAEPILIAMGFEGGEGLVTDEAVWSGTNKTYLLNGVPQRVYIGDVTDTEIDVVNVRGEFADNSAYLPGPPLTGGTFGLVQFGQGAFAVFEWVDADTIKFKRLSAQSDNITGEFFTTGVFSVPATDEVPELRQVYLLWGDFGEILTSVLASTGTAGYNHADWDNLPAQLGCAIPWELLGTSWLESVNALTSVNADSSVYLDRPTRLGDAIGVDMVARMATFIWKNQGLRIVAWGTPVASQATHVFTEANKAAPGDTRDDQVTVSQVTDQYICNHLKLFYNKRPDGTFRFCDSIEHPQSIDAEGSAAKSLEMRNHFGGINNSDGIAAIREGLISTVPMFGSPLHMVRRTVSFNYFENVSPGDVCLLSDDNVRDPATGERGITNKPGLITGVRIDWGGYEQDSRETRPMVGEVDILLLPIDFVAPYSPAALLSSYNAGTKTITTSAHSFSHANEAVDASRFSAGEKILVLQRDPDDPAAAQSWSDTVVSVSGNDIVITTGLAGYSALLSYVVISDAYGTALDSQRSDCYQADNSDGEIVDTVPAYQWGANANQAGTFTKITVASAGAELYSQNLYGDGKPLDVFQERLLSRLINDLVNHRTVTFGCSMGRSIKQVTPTGGGAARLKGILEVLPIHFGPGDIVVGERVLYLAPFLRRSANGTEEFLTATLCSRRPIGSSMYITDLDAPEYQLAGQLSESVTWGVDTNTWAMGDEQSVSVRVANPYTGVAYLVVEGEAEVQTYGMSWILGPYLENG